MSRDVMGCLPAARLPASLLDRSARNLLCALMLACDGTKGATAWVK
jgi:hypothetical protein